MRAALRDRTFWRLVQVMFFTAVGMYLIIVQSVAYLVDVGYTALQAATAFGAAGALSVVGVSSSGWLADRFGHRRAATVSFIGTFLGISLLLAMSFGASPAMLVAYVLLFGICQGARGPLAAGLSARLFSGPGQATIYGVIFACMSVGPHRLMPPARCTTSPAATAPASCCRWSACCSQRCRSDQRRALVGHFRRAE